jgi:hypothetical protein
VKKNGDTLKKVLFLLHIYNRRQIIMDVSQYLGFLLFLFVFTAGFWLLIFLLTFVVPYWIAGSLLENFTIYRAEKSKK